MRLTNRALAIGAALAVGGIGLFVYMRKSKGNQATGNAAPGSLFGPPRPANNNPPNQAQGPTAGNNQGQVPSYLEQGADLISSGEKFANSEGGKTIFNFLGKLIPSGSDGGDSGEGSDDEDDDDSDDDV